MYAEILHLLTRLDEPYGYVGTFPGASLPGWAPCIAFILMHVV